MWALAERYASVTPLQLDLTAHEMLETTRAGQWRLQAVLNGNGHC
jgi:hypothetical protein